MIRAILFDFNGVLVDDEPLHLELVQEVLREEGLRLDDADYFARYLGINDQACFAGILRAAGEDASPARLSRLVARKSAYYQMRIRRDGFPFVPGAAELIDEVSAAGLMLGVVSGALRTEVLGALDQLGRRDRFKVVVAIDDVGRGKPDPEGYRLGLQRLSSEPPLPERIVHPHEVLAIEDSPVGLEAASAAGCSTLGVAQTYAEEEIRPLADQVIARLRDTSLADLQQRFA